MTYWLRWVAAVVVGLLVLPVAWIACGVLLPYVTVGFEESQTTAQIFLPLVFAVGAAVAIAPKRKPK